MSDNNIIAIQVDQAALGTILNEVVGKAVAQGAQSWKINEAVREHVEAAMVQADLPRLVGERAAALLDQHTEQIVEAALRDMLPALTSCVSELIRRAMTAMHYGLELGPPSSYDESGKAAWKRAEQRIAAAREGEESTS
jgi:hypothetical protein